MSDPSDMVKTAAVQAAHTPTSGGDSQLDLVMQSLMIDDTDVKRILKGEIHEPLSRFKQLTVLLEQHLAVILDTQSVAVLTNEQNAGLLKEMGNIKQILKLIAEIEEKIYGQLESYHEYIPYLLLLSPSSVLSNITSQQAEMLWRKAKIMLMRSKLKSKRKSRTMESRNFYDAVGIKLFLTFQRSINGATFKGLVQEKREVTTVIQDATREKKRRLF